LRAVFASWSTCVDQTSTLFNTFQALSTLYVTYATIFIHFASLMLVCRQAWLAGFVIIRAHIVTVFLNGSKTDE